MMAAELVPKLGRMLAVCGTQTQGNTDRRHKCGMNRKYTRNRQAQVERLQVTQKCAHKTKPRS